MTWLPESATGATPIERAFGLRPDLFAACRDFAALFWRKQLVDLTLLELCRMRVGQMVGAELPALGDAGTVAFVEALAILDGFSRFVRFLDLGVES